MARVDEGGIRDWLAGRIGAGIRLGLSTCSDMLERLGNPQSDFPSVHVAGTNGKGSLCAHLSSLGSRNGELIGLFTSPHLIKVEERARIDGTPVRPEAFGLFLEEVRAASLIEPRIEPTYFEATFLASMLAFSRSGVDRAIVETGLGGRLDSTNLVEPDICAITTISMDHSEILGSTLSEIAFEKAGIHKEGAPLVCLEHEDPEVRGTIEGVAGQDVVWFSPSGSDAQLVSREMALEIGSMIGWEALDSPVRWAGRTHESSFWSGAECHLSAAHNSESMAHDLARISGSEHVLVLGMTDKGSLPETILPLSDSSGRLHCIVTEVHGGRKPTVPAEELAAEMQSICGDRPEVVPDPARAMDQASKVASDLGCSVYVTGSVYLVGQVIEESLSREGSDPWDALTIHPPGKRTEG